MTPSQRPRNVSSQPVAGRTRACLCKAERSQLRIASRIPERDDQWQCKSCHGNHDAGLSRRCQDTKSRRDRRHLHLRAHCASTNPGEFQSSAQVVLAVQDGRAPLCLGYKLPAVLLQPCGLVNMLFPLALCAAGTSSCITSQCSAILPLATRKMSTATMGFGPHPT